MGNGHAHDRRMSDGQQFLTAPGVVIQLCSHPDQEIGHAFSARRGPGGIGEPVEQRLRISMLDLRQRQSRPVSKCQIGQVRLGRRVESDCFGHIDRSLAWTRNNKVRAGAAQTKRGRLPFAAIVERFIRCRECSDPA